MNIVKHSIAKNIVIQEDHIDGKLLENSKRLSDEIADGEEAKEGEPEVRHRDRLYIA